MSVNKIWGMGELMDVATFLEEKSYDTSNITIQIEVPDEKMLNRVNDDFFYRNNREANNATPEPVDAVNVNIGNVHFKYIVSNKE